MICTDCKNKKDAAQTWHGLIDAVNHPELKASMDAFDHSFRDGIQRMADFINSALAKGLICEDCHITFKSDDIRWVYQSYPLNHRDIINRVIHKGEYVEVVNLNEQ